MHIVDSTYEYSCSAVRNLHITSLFINNGNGSKNYLLNNEKVRTLFINNGEWNQLFLNKEVHNSIIYK